MRERVLCILKPLIPWGVNLKKSCIYCLMLAAALVLATFTGQVAYEQVATIIKIVPPPIEVEEGQIFNISIVICDAIDIIAFQFKISWDPEYLDYVPTCTIFPPWQPPVIIPEPITNETEGYMVIGATALQPPGFSGSATVASISFQALKSGSTTIAVSETMLDPDPIILLTEDATITILYFEHDVAVKEVVPRKTVLGQGYSMNVSVTVENQGNHTETFNVTAYANSTAIQTKIITLEGNASTTMNFTWTSTSFAKGNYTISAVADTVPGETQQDDNAMFNGWVFVTIPGDFNKDRKVDMRDLGEMARNFCAASSFCILCWPHRLNPDHDFNNDGKVDMRDIGITARSFGKWW